MDTLLQLLHAIDNTDLPNNEETVLNHLKEGEQGDLIKKAEATAELALINQGQNNWTNHRLLEAQGFPVSCGERDSFGWLSGIIQTKKGILIYG